MTDLEKFIELYRSVGIEVQVRDVVDSKKGAVREIFIGDYYNPNIPKKSDKFFGYVGFYSNIEFDKDGKFIGQGFWE